jgi:retron-type reverse transcriptase
MRQLSIPSIRDRVVQGAMKLILEPIFEADFQRSQWYLSLRYGLELVRSSYTSKHAQFLLLL